MSSPRILLVDDDADARRMFATALRATGEVTQAEGGGRALELLGAERYDLIVLDLHMPDVDGFAVLEALASPDATNREVPVIVVTADGSDEARKRALRSRSVYFLSKPVPLRVLASLVESTLGRYAPAKPPRG